LMAGLARGQFVAFNDHAPGTIGVTTHSNATTWNILRSSPGATGPLEDIDTGAALPVTVTITTNGFLTAGSTGANPGTNTPLYNTFNGYVDFRAAGRSDAVVHIFSNAVVTYTFTGLNPNRAYSFMGSAVRGGSGGTYPQRWTLFQLDGAVAFKTAHTTGCYTNGLGTNQVAINTGINTNGEMVDWEAIIPGTNGTFRVTSTQYNGPIPAGGTANGPYGYALNGFRLLEYAPPVVTSARTLDNNTLQVVFSIPVLPATATNLANYSLTNLAGPVALLGATLAPDGQTVQFTTASQAPFGGHWLSVSGVADAATGLSFIAPNTQIVYQAIPFTAGYIKRELYLNISNSTVASLTNSAKFPNSPDQIDYPPSLGWPQENIGTNYGGRLSGWLVPPLSGDYYFAIRSDDTSQLWLSPSADPAAKSLLINAAICCQPFDTYTNGPIPLVAGQRYYLEALMKENSGGDFLYVAWKMPTNMAWTVIPGQYLGNYLSALNSTLTIRQQPTNTTVLAGQRASFSVAAIGTSSITTNVSYKWQLNGFDIPGATSAAYTTPAVTAGDNGEVYRVVVSVPGRGLVSSSAMLTVLPDTVAPFVVDAFNAGPTNVQLIFSEPLDALSAANRFNYAVSGGITVIGATLNADNTIVTLTTSPLLYGSNYSIQLDNLRDRATSPNTIPPNTLVSFQALPYALQDIGAVATTLTVVSNGV
ncbi:MAG TPA: hypothetical protein VNT26_16315, partial [Candidatus Sulfotelmatobacter sp.]|nr:hypothetical protein [Candidatus Sulfotelmatobacter sp.]